MAEPFGSSTATALTQLTGDGQFVAAFKNLPSGALALATASDGSVYVGGFTDGTDVTSTPGAWLTSTGGLLDGFSPR